MRGSKAPVTPRVTRIAWFFTLLDHDESNRTSSIVPDWLEAAWSRSSPLAPPAGRGRRRR